MATTCRTSKGDILDVICQHYYGHLNGTVEAVLDANQGLAEEPQPFRDGIRISLPVVSNPVENSLSLWD
jgi:phage tail protein X